jgi:hypothetical protein
VRKNHPAHRVGIVERPVGEVKDASQVTATPTLITKPPIAGKMLQLCPRCAPRGSSEALVLGPCTTSVRSIPVRTNRLLMLFGDHPFLELTKPKPWRSHPQQMNREVLRLATA